MGSEQKSAGRGYRRQVNSGDLSTYRVALAESDLLVSTPDDYSLLVERELHRLRREIEDYVRLCSDFLSSFSPLEVPAEAAAVVRDMAQAAAMAQVGPSAAIAGAIADNIGQVLLGLTDDVIIENGGDIFLSTSRPRRVLVQAADSPFSGRLALKVQPESSPLGICTSSGTCGHATSLGRADAALAVADSAALADAVATALGNRVQEAADVEDALAFAATVPGVRGALIIIGKHLGAWGDVELVAVGG